MNIYNVRSLSVSFRLFLYPRSLGIIYNTCSCVLSQAHAVGFEASPNIDTSTPTSPKAADKTLVDSALIYSEEVFARR